MRLEMKWLQTPQDAPALCKRSGIGAMWASTKGICVGTPDGRLINLTSRRLDYPGAIFGAGICFDDRYVCTLEP